MQLPENLLCDQRPIHTLDQVESAYLKACDDDKTGWANNGNGDDYHFVNLYNYPSAIGVTTEFTNKVLIDVGAGRAKTTSAIALKAGYTTAVALGASKPSDCPSYVNYIDGRIECRETYERINQLATLIVSKYAYLHFADPLGSLELALNCLEKDGLMLVGQFLLNANFGFSTFKEIIRQSGAEIVDTDEGWGTSFAVKRVSEEAIRFPLRYVPCNRARFGFALDLDHDLI